MTNARRNGAFLEIIDDEGCRHIVHVRAIQILSDTDPLQNETLITAAGRILRVSQGLDEVAGMVLDCGRARGGR